MVTKRTDEYDELADEHPPWPHIVPEFAALYTDHDYTELVGLIIAEGNAVRVVTNDEKMYDHCRSVFSSGNPDIAYYFEVGSPVSVFFKAGYAPVQIYDLADDDAAQNSRPLLESLLKQLAGANYDDVLITLNDLIDYDRDDWCHPTGATLTLLDSFMSRCARPGLVDPNLYVTIFLEGIGNAHLVGRGGGGSGYASVAGLRGMINGEGPFAVNLITADWGPSIDGSLVAALNAASRSGDAEPEATVASALADLRRGESTLLLEGIRDGELRNDTAVRDALAQLVEARAAVEAALSTYGYSE